MRERIRHLVDSRAFQLTITAIILVDAIVLGVITSSIPQGVATVLSTFNRICLVIYAVEIVLRIYAHGTSFFKDPWSVFDFVIVALALLPTSLLPLPIQIGRLLRIFRALRILRVVSSFSQLRAIIEATVRSVPGVLWTAVLMFVVQYIYAIVGTVAFSQELPQYFGSMSRSIFTLFEIMTFDGWSSVAERTMTIFPWSWAYFMSFVIISSFILMNVVVGVIVNSVQNCQQSIDSTMDDLDGTDDALLDAKLNELQRQMDEVGRMLADRRRNSSQND